MVWKGTSLAVLTGAFPLLVACATEPVTMDAIEGQGGVECVVSTEEVNGVRVTLVRPARPPRLARRQVPFRFASAGPDTRSLVPNTSRLLKVVHALMDDPQIGPFIQEMAHDPDVTYWIYEHRLRRNGGGKTDHCDVNRFDIWVDLDFHKAQEGSPCSNPKGSGKLASLLAHELGHAWAWHHYGNDDSCDNRSRGNVIAVAWENTQLAGSAQRLVHNRPGCRCDN